MNFKPLTLGGITFFVASFVFAGINWALIEERTNAYVNYPSEENASLLYQALPSEIVSDADRKAGLKAISVIREHENINMIWKHVAAQERNAVKVTFRLLTFLEGSDGEGCFEELGMLIRTNPEMFLEEVKIHRAIVGPYLGNLTSGLGGPYADRMEAQKLEKKLRAGALKRVNRSDLKEIRDECLKQLVS